MPAAQIYRRPTLVTVLSVLNFIGAPITLLMGFFMIYLGQTDEGIEMRGLMVGIGAVYFALGVMSLLIGIGLWNLKSYGRTLQIISSCIGLLAIPLGTIISGLILWYFFKPGVKVLFSERPVANLSDWEIAEVSKLGQSSAALVILLAIVLPLLVVMYHRHHRRDRDTEPLAGTGLSKRGLRDRRYAPGAQRAVRLRSGERWALRHAGVPVGARRVHPGLSSRRSGVHERVRRWDEAGIPA